MYGKLTHYPIIKSHFQLKFIFSTPPVNVYGEITKDTVGIVCTDFYFHPVEDPFPLDWNSLSILLEGCIIFLTKKI